MPGTINNTGQLYRDANKTKNLANGSATLFVYDDSNIVMTKVVDKPGEIYFPGDLVVFTITIKNQGSKNMSGLYFEDAIDSSIIPTSGTNFTVTTTAGTITSYVSPIKIANITITAGATATITITGKLAL